MTSVQHVGEDRRGWRGRGRGGADDCVGRHVPLFVRHWEAGDMVGGSSVGAVSVQCFVYPLKGGGPSWSSSLGGLNCLHSGFLVLTSTVVVPIRLV